METNTFSFLILRNLSRDAYEIRLLRLLGQHLEKHKSRDFDVAIKQLYLTNREYQSHNGKYGTERTLIDHNACEILRKHLLPLDGQYAPFMVKPRLKALDKLINNLRLK